MIAPGLRYERTDWKPIETAPRVGQFVLLYAARYEPPVSLGYWDDAFGLTKYAGWMMIEMDTMLSAANPTHWMPLPPPPSQEVEP